MKGITLLLALIIIAPIRVFAQGNISVGGMGAFYQPALDEIKEPYEDAPTGTRVVYSARVRDHRNCRQGLSL